MLLHDGLLGLSAAQGVFRILEPRPSVQWSGTQSLVDTSLTFESVSFAYPSGRGPTHERLSFQVASGERIAVVGASGAGKSTIIKLLLRHYDPDRGIVRVGQRDVRDVDRDALLSQVSVVSQDTFLFHGTIEENVRFGKPDASADELACALEQANASEFVRRLPEGVSTVIGERGVRLSGGQRQRIAIARAVLKGAPILMLDEALSAVDAQNEAGIQQALQRLMRGRTTLIIAHRLSSVIGCDRILVLDRGTVVEEGTHEALMANGTHYPALMAPQLASQKTGDRAVAPKNITAAPASYRAQVAVPSEGRRFVGRSFQQRPRCVAGREEAEQDRRAFRGFGHPDACARPSPGWQPSSASESPVRTSSRRSVRESRLRAIWWCSSRSRPPLGSSTGWSLGSPTTWRFRMLSRMRGGAVRQARAPGTRIFAPSTLRGSRGARDP